MNKEQIIKDLKLRQRALNKQSEDIAEESGDEGETWDAEVSAKLDLVNDLLEEYTKQPKKKKR